jgi:hypothetical protein
MPIIIINLGGEMMYILEQRLHAQAIPDDKAKKGAPPPLRLNAAVLQDILRTMYNAKFLEELFKPQSVYNVSSARQVFDRIAHSSIMRLSESSMDKVLRPRFC